jgi:hypothetical protein
MRVGHCLPGGLANVDPDVVAIRSPGGFNLTPDCRNKSPDGELFITGEGEKVGLVPSRDNQAMPLVQRIRVEKRHGEVVRRN